MNEKHVKILLDRLSSDKQMCEEAVMKGAVVDFAAYKEAVGKINAYSRAIEHVKDTYKEYMNDDDS